MADGTAPMVTGSSKHAVAYAMMIGIAHNDGKIYYCGSTPVVNADAKYVTDLYQQCLRAVGD